MKHSVLVIKSVGDESSSSCCSGSGSGESEVTGFETFYKDIKGSYKDLLDLHVLDPRNSFLIFVLIKDCLRFKVPILTLLKTIFTYSVPSVIIDGEVVFKTIPALEDFKSYMKTLSK